MIIGYLDNCERYVQQIPALSEIRELVRTCMEKEPGRYEADWGFYMIQDGITMHFEEKDFECHKNYIDVQCVAEGEEYVEWADLRELTESTAYDEEGDCQFLKGSGVLCRIQKGMFYAVYPEDGHKPGCHPEMPLIYRKVVAKVRV